MTHCLVKIKQTLQSMKIYQFPIKITTMDKMQTYNIGLTTVLIVFYKIFCGVFRGMFNTYGIKCSKNKCNFTCLQRENIASDMGDIFITRNIITSIRKKGYHPDISRAQYCACSSLTPLCWTTFQITSPLIY